MLLAILFLLEAVFAFVYPFFFQNVKSFAGFLLDQKLDFSKDFNIKSLKINQTAQTVSEFIYIIILFIG